jgi:Xaa-Pro dipeptidase
MFYLDADFFGILEAFSGLGERCTGRDGDVGRISRFSNQGVKSGEKNISVDGLASAINPDGWFPYSIYHRILELVPGANLINIGDMLEKIRAIKSFEEIEVLEKAARLGDLMLETCAQTAKHRVGECEIYGKMMETMPANGGEEPTLFFWASDVHPFHLSTLRPLEIGDLIICEMHPKYAGYCTHVERTFCLGEPAKEYLNIYEGCLKAYERGMELLYIWGKN